MTEFYHFDGANPLQSNVSAHTVQLSQDAQGLIRLPYTDFVDLMTDGAQRIRKRRGKGTTLGTLSGPVIALHEFERVDPVTGASTYYQIAATAAAIYLYTGGVFVLQTLPIAVTGGAQWFFANHNNRCYAVNGKDAAIVFDGASWRVVGIDAPAAAPTYQLTGLVTFGHVNMTNGSPTVTVVGESLALLTSVGTVATATTTRPHNLVSGDSVIITGATQAAYNITAAVIVTSSTTFTYNFAGAASPATGAPKGQRVWPTGAVWVTPPLDINGNMYKIGTVDTSTSATLTENFKEATQVDLLYIVHSGVMGWDEPLFYGFTFYDDTTGHSSDLSPRMLMTEKNQAGVTPVITIAAAQQLQDAWVAGYRKIKLFRSFRDGSALVAMNVDINNVNSNSTPIVFTETVNTAKDTILTDFLAPENSNKKPPTALVAIASWLNRLVGIRPSDPTNTPPDEPRFYFSAISPDDVRFGVPEWCWPRRFSRSGIAQPRHLLVLGNDSAAGTLVIPGSDGDYTIEGYDRLTFTQPFRLATRRAGGSLFGAIDVGGELVELYRDKRLFHGGIDTARDIQDKLNAISAQYIGVSRLRDFAYEEDNLLFITVPKGASTNNYTLVLDYDRKRFNEFAFGYTAIGTFHSATGALELWIGDSTGNVYKLLQPGVFVDGASTTYAPFFRSVPIRSSTRKMTHRVHIFVNPPGAEALTWQLNYRLDEDPVGTTVNFSPATTGFQSAQGRELVADFEVPAVWNTSDYKVIFPSTSTDLIVEKMLVVVSDEQRAAVDAFGRDDPRGANSP